MSYYFSKKIESGFDEAVEQVTAKLAEHGFGIITRIDMSKTFKEKLNVDVSLPYSEQESILKIRTLTCQEITQIPEFYEVSEFDKNFKLIA